MSKFWLHGYIGYPSTERLLGGGLRLGTAAAVIEFLESKRRPRGGQEAAKTATFSHLFLNTFLDRFFIDFPSNLAPFWPPKSKKIGKKSMSRWLPIITSFFDRFLIDFCFQLRPPDSSKPLFFLGKTRFFQIIAVRSWDRFSMPFGCQLGSILLPKSSNILQKSDPKRH